MNQNDGQSIKKASFNIMLKYSLYFGLLIFGSIIIFVGIITFNLMSKHEINMANLVLDKINIKYDNVKNITNEISDIIASDNFNDMKKILDEVVENQTDIIGVFVLDSSGKVINTNTELNSYIGYDLGKREYFIKVIDQKETIMSEPFISYETDRFSIAVTSPIIIQEGLEGVVMTLLSPDIIHSEQIKELDYYVANKYGDIIFDNNNLDFEYIDNIYQILSQRDNIQLDKPQLLLKNNKYVITLAKYDAMNETYILLEYNIFEDKILIISTVIVITLSIFFIILFLFLFSAKFSNTVEEFINIFMDRLDKIKNGNYNVNIDFKYDYNEVQNVFNKFEEMTNKVNSREQELQVYNEEMRAANDDIKKMLVMLNKNEKEKKDQYIQIIGTMLNLIEIKDEYTAGHSVAVTNYSELIANKLNENYGFNIDIEKLRVGAILHDIGKIGIETKILNKPSKLSDEEFEIIKTHPNKGYYAIKDIENLNDEKEMVRYHHERYDGKGYPEGLSAETIPLGARIICVADAYDAMTSNRPYRKSLPIEVAKEELIKNKRKQFDPLVVDAFISIIENKN